MTTNYNIFRKHSADKIKSLVTTVTGLANARQAIRSLASAEAIFMTSPNVVLSKNSVEVFSKTYSIVFSIGKTH
ncbi:MAG: hypothetical protein M0R06_08345 [Sphaerochaeta sp.]|nr:hypothetical protein [Sphaerochaeta sp.]